MAGCPVPLCLWLGCRPTISPTILMSNMYQRPDMTTPGGEPDKNMDPKKVQEHFEDFYEDLFEELSKYGEIDSLNVCDNLADHMVGGVEPRTRPEGCPPPSSPLFVMAKNVQCGVGPSPLTSFVDGQRRGPSCHSSSIQSFSS